MGTEQDEKRGDSFPESSVNAMVQTQVAFPKCQWRSGRTFPEVLGPTDGFSNLSRKVRLLILQPKTTHTYISGKVKEMKR